MTGFRNKLKISRTKTIKTRIKKQQEGGPKKNNHRPYCVFPVTIKKKKLSRDFLFKVTKTSRYSKSRNGKLKTNRTLGKYGNWKYLDVKSLGLVTGRLYYEGLKFLFPFFSYSCFALMFSPFPVMNSFYNFN